MSAYHTGFDVGLPSDARGSKSGGGCFRKSITFTAVLATLFSAAALALVVYVGFYTDDDTVKTQPIVIRVGQATPLKGYASARSFFEGTGSWAAKEPLPAGTSDFVAVTVGDKIYLIGGQDASGSSTTVVREYDPVIDDYNSTKAALSVGRMRYGAAAVGTKIYVIGGLAVDVWGGPHEHTTLIYDTATDTWTAGPALITGRSDLCAFAVGTKVYAVGGYTDSYVTLDSVEVLDTSASSPAWAAAPSLPEARGDVTCAAAGGKGYAIGGFYDPTGTFADLDQFTEHVFELDVAGGAAAWTNKSSLPVAVGDKAAAAPRRLHRGYRRRDAPERRFGVADRDAHVPAVLPRARHLGQEGAASHGALQVRRRRRRGRIRARVRRAHALRSHKLHRLHDGLRRTGTGLARDHVRRRAPRPVDPLHRGALMIRLSALRFVKLFRDETRAPATIESLERVRT